MRADAEAEVKRSPAHLQTSEGDPNLKLDDYPGMWRDGALSDE